MSETPKFKVGDRVRSTGTDAIGVVLADKPDRWGKLPIAWENFTSTVYGVVETEHLALVPTFPERWINIYPGAVTTMRTAEEAERNRMADCLAVLHLRPDGTTEMLDPNTEEPIA